MKYRQPVVHLPYTPFERIADALSVALALISLLLAISKYPELPAQIPGHFNASGEVDGYSSRGTIFILPVLSLVMAVGFIILSRFPHRFNFPYQITEENAPFEYRKARIMLRVVSVFSTLLFLVLTWNIIRAVNNKPELSALFWIPLIILMIAPMAIMLGWRQKR